LFAFEEIKKSFLVSIWFMFLTFPIMVIKVNTVENIVEWRWERMFMIGIGSFFLSFIWRYMLKRKESGQKSVTSTASRGTGDSPVNRAFIFRP
jgi:branched-chain amino acid transport system permease protein